jgi:hypothetical protein
MPIGSSDLRRLVGRADEVELLASLLDGARNAGSALVIKGEPGWGNRACSQKRRCWPAPDRARLAARLEAVDRADPRHNKRHRLEEHLAAANVQLTADELHEIRGHAAARTKVSDTPKTRSA